MQKLDLKKLSSLVSEKLGRNIEFVKSELAGSGYHSQGFKLTEKKGELYFVKKIKSNDLGFELPERKLHSLLISHGMSKRAENNGSPKSIGVIMDNKAGGIILPDITESTDFYHVQQFGGDGESYYSRLLKRKNKTELDDQDKKEIDAIVRYIAGVHSKKHPSKDKKRLVQLYNNGLRSVLVHPELTFLFLSDLTEDHEILSLPKQKEFISLMLENIHHFKGNNERLRALHGDFWGANVFIKPDGSVWVFDYSRIPWGDPGIDVGWWISQYIWLYHETQNDYFKKLTEYFFQRYEKRTGDKEIKKAVSIVLGLMAVINITPLFSKDLNVNVALPFFEHMLEVMRRKEFFWQ